MADYLDDEEDLDEETPEERALRLAQLERVPNALGDTKVTAQGPGDIPTVSTPPPGMDHLAEPTDESPAAVDPRVVGAINPAGLDDIDPNAAPTPASTPGPSTPSLSWVKAVDPANGKTVETPVPSGFDDAAANYGKILGQYPEKTPPKWWQRVGAGVAGGLAGWSNAASRTRNPIDIQAMDNNILAPGYESKLEQWRSRVAPAQAQLELAGQRVGAQQKAQETTADIAYKQAHANYMNGLGRTGPMVEVTPEMSDATNGMFKVGTKIPGSTATRIAEIQAGKFEKPERTIPVTDPGLAGIMGVKVGTEVPYGLYQTAVTSNNKPDRNMNPTDVLMHPQDFDTATIGNAQKIFDREHKAPVVNVNGGAADTPPPGNLSLTGDAYLKTLPAGMQGIVKAISDGRQRPITGYALTNPKGQGMAIMGAVNQYDPAWSEQRGELRKSFTVGPEGRNIGALNTATVHLDRWHEAAKAMNNGTWQPGNQMWNYVAAKFGADAPTNHAFVLNALAGEAASALKGNATDPEIAHVLSTLQPNLAPKQAQGVAEEGLRIFGDKLNTYDERYHQMAGGDDQWSPILPSARGVFQRYRQQPIVRQRAPQQQPRQQGAPQAAQPSGHVQVMAPNGQPLYFPSQAQADAFKKAHQLN